MMERIKNISAYQWLVWLTVGLICLGLVMVYSASGVGTTASRHVANQNSFFYKQLVSAVLGLGLLYVISSLRPEFIKKLIAPVWFLSLILVVAVLIPGIGIRVNDSLRWIRIAGFTLQPSELFKLADVLLFSCIIGKMQEQNRSLSHKFLACGIVLLPLLFIYLEPDLGCTMVIAAMLLVLFFLGGMPWQLIPFIFIVGLTGVGLVLSRHNFNNYHVQRVMAWRNPEQYADSLSYQVIRSKASIGNGGIFGTGLGNGLQKNTLPEAHTDYIISVIGEELGLVMIVLVIMAFVGILLAGLRVYKSQENISNRLMIIGCIMMVVLPAFVNISMAMNLLPSKGLALPFLSYGGTSMVVSSIAIGIICCFARETGEENG